ERRGKGRGAERYSEERGGSSRVEGETRRDRRVVREPHGRGRMDRADDRQGGHRRARRAGELRAKEALVARLRRWRRILALCEALGRVREVVEQRRLLPDGQGERDPEHTPQSTHAAHYAKHASIRSASLHPRGRTISP